MNPVRVGKTADRALCLGLDEETGQQRGVSSKRRQKTTSCQDGETIARSLDRPQKGKLMPKEHHDSMQGLNGSRYQPC